MEGDNGLKESWGLYLKQPNKDWCKYFQGLRMIDGEMQEEDDTLTQETVTGKCCSASFFNGFKEMNPPIIHNMIFIM